ncbi:MAG: hypothetical protein VX729_15005 [Pseudomonadota bacterium]|nr:hypothetical protein [Pseudomonadota bacterium]
MSKNNSEKNIYLQAKRASKVFDIPLSRAKDVVAQSIYRCHDYIDLSRKIRSKSLKASAYPFSKVSPENGEDALAYLNNHVEHLKERFSKCLAKPISQRAFSKSIQRIFGFEAEENLLDDFYSFSNYGWKVYTKIQGNKDTVYYKDFTLNGVMYRLLAVNVITACSFQNNSLNQVQVLYSEFQKYQFPPIAWRRWEEWQEEADIYFNTIGIKDAPQKNAFNSVAKPKNQQQEEFQQNVNKFLTVIKNENLVSKLQTVQMSNFDYLMIGFAVDEGEIVGETLDYYLTDENLHNFKTAFSVGDGTICLEVFEVNEEGKYIGVDIDYYAEAKQCYSAFNDYIEKYIVINKRRYEAFFRPCFEVESDRLNGSTLVTTETCMDKLL